MIRAIEHESGASPAWVGSHRSAAIVDESGTSLLNGDEAAEAISSPLGDATYPVFPVPPEAIAQAPAHPRLRRASAISRFAVVAGLAALEDARLEARRRSGRANRADLRDLKRRRHLHQALLSRDRGIGRAGRQSAALSRDGLQRARQPSGGDSRHHRRELHPRRRRRGRNPGDENGGGPDGESETLDRCLVVGAEEADWLLCDAYRKWRLLRPAPPIEPFAQPPKGMILSEGAGRGLAGTKGRSRARADHAGGNFAKQSELVRQLDMICGSFPGKEAVDILIASANGTFVDAAERATAAKHFPTAAFILRSRRLGKALPRAGFGS